MKDDEHDRVIFWLPFYTCIIIARCTKSQIFNIDFLHKKCNLLKFLSVKLTFTYLKLITCITHKSNIIMRKNYHFYTKNSGVTDERFINFVYYPSNFSLFTFVSPILSIVFIVNLLCNFSLSHSDILYLPLTLNDFLMCLFVTPYHTTLRWRRALKL